MTFSEKLLTYFTKEHGNETFAQNANFFFSPILDEQEDIKYGQGIVKKCSLKSGLQEEERKKEDLPDDDEEEKKEAPVHKKVKGLAPVKS